MSRHRNFSSDAYSKKMVHFCVTEYFLVYLTVKQGGALGAHPFVVITFVYFGVATSVIALSVAAPATGSLQVLLAWIM